MNSPSGKRSGIDDIRALDIKGPWQTKSGGTLSALFNLPLEILQSEFFNYENEELSAIPEDIRGLRAYLVKDIPIGTIGANEWHKLRHELVFALTGRVIWHCIDTYGHEMKLTLRDQRGVWIPPYILHKYEAVEDASALLVVTNTLFNPESSETHDSFSAQSFPKNH